jgi:hypothetical protein
VAAVLRYAVKRIGEPSESRGAHRGDQRLLVGEVAIGRHRAAAHFRRQPPHRQRRLAFRQEDARSGIAQPLAHSLPRRRRPRALGDDRSLVFHVYDVRLLCEIGK